MSTLVYPFLAPDVLKRPTESVIRSQMEYEWVRLINLLACFSVRLNKFAEKLLPKSNEFIDFSL